MYKKITFFIMILCALAFASCKSAVPGSGTDPVVETDPGDKPGGDKPGGNDPTDTEPADVEPDYSVSVEPSEIIMADWVAGDNNNRLLYDIVIANTGNYPTGPLSVSITGTDAKKFEFNNNAKNTVVPYLAANGLDTGEALLSGVASDQTTSNFGPIGVRVVSGTTTGNYSAVVSVTGGNDISVDIPVSIAVRASGAATVISFDLNGGSGVVPGPITAGAGAAITLPDGSGFSKTGYVFNGWNTEASGIGAGFNPGGSYHVVTDKTLYADWITANVLDISYQPLNPGDVLSPFLSAGINPTLTSRDNLQNSVLGVQVDGPGTSSSYTGYTWDDPRQNNIRVLDNRNKAVSPYVNGDGIFEFYLHSTRDYDGSNTDRQRIEIKGSTSTSQGTDFKGFNDQIVTYFWKFRLAPDIATPAPAGFYHVFQIKATQGGEAGSPLITFSVTSSELQFRQVSIGADMNTAQTIAKIPISSAAGRWLAAEVTVHFSDNGYVWVKLTDVMTGRILMNAQRACDTWRRPEIQVNGVWTESDQPAVSNQLNRPKWGLYRKLNSSSAEATMMWADMAMIKRNRATYIFPDGHIPQ